jgi:uncharacterized membrane protein
MDVLDGCFSLAEFTDFVRVTIMLPGYAIASLFKRVDDEDFVNRCALFFWLAVIAAVLICYLR